VRKVKVKRGGEIGEVEQYYHSSVVAMLLGPVLDVVLGIEPVLTRRHAAISTASMPDTMAN